MTNEEILCKLRQDIRLRGLTSATEEEYLLATNTFIKFYDNQSIFNMTDSCGNLRDKAILMTIYGAGLRLSEACRLRGQDIYASSMRIKVCNGKGGKDRFTLLSQKNLDVLTEYWYAYKPKHPDGYLFLTKLGNPVSCRTVQDLFHKAKSKAGITKHVSVHTLRHDFATHLLQSGTDVCRILSFSLHLQHSVIPQCCKCHSV